LCFWLALLEASGIQGEMKCAVSEGELVYIGCDLEKSESERAEPGRCGGDRAVKPSDGAYAHVSGSGYSTVPLEGQQYAGENTKIRGKHYDGANQLDVSSFDIDGGKMS
jgi:hypothetical protein